MWLAAHRAVVGVLASAVLSVVPGVGSDAEDGDGVVIEPWGTWQTLDQGPAFPVAIHGDTAVVAGEPGEGIVEIFAWSGSEWTLAHTLEAPTTESGYELDIHGDVMAVSWVTYEPDAATAAVSLFELHSGRWEHVAELENIGARSISVWGDTVAVAGWDAVTDYFGVYVYERVGDGWERTADLHLTRDGCITTSVDVWKNRLVFGVHYDWDPCSRLPAAYVYRRVGDSWVEEQRLPGTRGRSTGSQWVTIWDDTVAVGDPVTDHPTERLSKVRIYEREGHQWSQTQVIKRSREAFGESVALHKDTLVVGDPREGRAWVFTRIDGRFRFARRLPYGGSVAVWGPTVLNASPAYFAQPEWRADAYRLTRCQGLVPTIVGTFDDDTLTGTAHADVILASAGNDRVDAGDGSDVACGRAGADRLIGRTGDDTIIGGRGHDILRGGFGDDLLRGKQGDDTIYGGPGDDYLRADQEDLFPNNDHLYGGQGHDVCVFAQFNIGCEEIYPSPGLGAMD